ncbi:MAG: DNA-3-methyladenine glycosylase [Verrucomicrobiota bacterium]|nr:DNA-3-methyladenine glycosylase [Verrucomicrobiota bacterium]
MVHGCHSIHTCKEITRLLPIAFYQDPDVLHLAKSLLGKLLLTRIDGHLTGGYITETEGYAGIGDRASHAYNNRRTERTEVMYRAGGIAYVYLCYGIHHLLNVVTGPEETPHAVLIRALKPAIGEDIMFQRRGKKPLTHGPGALKPAIGEDIMFQTRGKKPLTHGPGALKPAIGEDIMFQTRGKKPLTHGPGALTQALGITLKQNGQSLNSSAIWIEEGVRITSIVETARIGVDYAGDDALLPYRFIGECAIFKL